MAARRAPVSVAGMTAPPAIIRERVLAAYGRLLVGYSEWGGWLYHGWTDYSDSANYLGPTIWTEDDCVLRFCFELEKEFPLQVHCELSLDKATRHDYEAIPPGAAKAPSRWAVDIVVSDMDGFPADETSQETFRTRTHEAFIETKWLKKGWRHGTFSQEPRRRMDQIQTDLDKLAFNLERERCALAAMLVVDDEDYFEDHRDELDWPDRVEPLVLSPRRVAARAA
jgi:hypothetical protein